MEKNSVTVKIYNETYILKTEASHETAMEIAAVVDEKMRQRASLKAIQTPEKIAVWTALDLAAELYELRRKYKDILEAVRE